MLRHRPTQCAAKDGHGENQSFMGIYAARGGKHLPLCLLTHFAQCGKKASFIVPASPEKTGKPGAQGSGTIHKSKKIHIGVGSAVLPVYQARFGRYRNLTEHRLHRTAPNFLGPPVPEIVMHDRYGAAKKLLIAVFSTAAALFRCRSADQTPPCRIAQSDAGKTFSFPVQHIHIPESSQRMRLLQRSGNRLYLRWFQVQKKHGLISGQPAV